MVVVISSCRAKARHPRLARLTDGTRLDPGMNASATAVRFDDVTMWVELADGCSLGRPLTWFPRLLHAILEQRMQHRIGLASNGLHWEELDEDISIEGLLAGRGDLMAKRPAAV